MPVVMNRIIELPKILCISILAMAQKRGKPSNRPRVHWGRRAGYTLSELCTSQRKTAVVKKEVHPLSVFADCI